MNNYKTLAILRSTIEMQDIISISLFKEILNSLRQFIREEKIIFEIDRKNWGEVLLLIDNYLFKNTKFKPYYFLSDLEVFDFEEENNLTIDAIKEILKIEQLQFCTVKDISGNVTLYCQHWENQRRICVSIERELMKKVKQDRSISLVLSKKTVKANLGYYHRFTISEYFEPADDYNDNYDFDEDYAKSFGYDTVEEMVLWEAFEGDIDTLKHYNQ